MGSDEQHSCRAACNGTQVTLGINPLHSSLLKCATALLLACIVAEAVAQTKPQYPSRPVRMIVPYAPGGSSDFTARILQPHLAEVLGQQIVIDNRSGAAGYVGVEVAARASPDGHTVLFGNVGTIAINPALYPALAVKPLRDLIAVTEVADLPSVLIVAPSLQTATLKDFVDHARKHPGKLNFAGTGSSNRIDTESFMRAAGIKLVHIPYKGGAGPAMLALLANETHVMFALLSGAAGFVKQGRLNALAITAAERSPVLPSVPTMPELGYPMLKSGSWQGLFVPAQTPPAIVQQLFAATNKAMQHPDIRRRLSENGVAIVLSASPEAFALFIRAESDRFAAIVKEVGITAEP